MQLLMPKVVHDQIRCDWGDNQYVLDRIAEGQRYYREGKDITDEIAVDAQKRRDTAAAMVSAYTPY